MSEKPKNFEAQPLRHIFSTDKHIFKQTVRNVSLKTCTYELFSPDPEHFRISSQKSFSLAPGMQWASTIEHKPGELCSSKINQLRITSKLSESFFIELLCKEPPKADFKMIDCLEHYDLGDFKPYEQQSINIPVANVSGKDIKLEVRAEAEGDLLNMLHTEFSETKVILLKDKSTNLHCKMYIKEPLTFKMTILFTLSTEDCEGKKQYHRIEVTGNSRSENIYVTDETEQPIELLSKIYLNGTEAVSELTLINDCRRVIMVRLSSEIEAESPADFAKKWSMAHLILSNDEMVMQPFSRNNFKYTIRTAMTENDIQFTQKYSRLSKSSKTDQNLAYKLKNGLFFKKNTDLYLKVYPQGAKPLSIRFACVIVNPALLVNRINCNNETQLEIFNDTGLAVPYSFDTNALFKVQPMKGMIKQGLMSMEPITIKWSQQHRCNVPMNLSSAKIFIFEQLEGSLDKQMKHLEVEPTSRPTLNAQKDLQRRLPSAKIQQLTAKDYLPDKPRYRQFNELSNSELIHIILSRKDRSHLLTNTHPEKSSLVYFKDKGYLLIQPLHGYAIPFQENSVSYVINKQTFVLANQNETSTEAYSISKNEIFFQFTSNQKEFEVSNSFQIVNKGKDVLHVYCLSIDDQYFFSCEPNRKIQVAPNSTAEYHISFFPKTTICLRENRVIRQMEFLIAGRTQIVTCIGQLLSSQCDFQPKSIRFNDCHFGEERTTQTLILNNLGAKKLLYMIQFPEEIEIVPKMGSICSRMHTNCEVSFNPIRNITSSNSTIRVYIKGSHVLVIPFSINTLPPEIVIVQKEIYFGEVLINDYASTPITIYNRNKSSCQVMLDFSETAICLKEPGIDEKRTTITIKAGQSVDVELQLLIIQEGFQVVKLPDDIAILNGYGPIPFPGTCRYVGKKSFLQVTPIVSVHEVQLSEQRSTYTITLKNIERKLLKLRLELSKPDRMGEAIMVTFDPTNVTLNPQESKQICLSAYVLDSSNREQSVYLCRMNVYLDDQTEQHLFQWIRFTVSSPHLEVVPKELYFSTVELNVWSQATFKVVNKGYREIYLKLLQPTNIAFEMETSFKANNNKLTQINNQLEISMMFRSKKKVSFNLMLEVQDSQGKKYNIRLIGTATDSPFFSNIQSATAMSSKSFSSSMTTQTITIDHLEESENAKFFNFWLPTLIVEMGLEKRPFNTWLARPENLLKFLAFFGLVITIKKPTGLLVIIHELKKVGFLLNSLKVDKLEQGDQFEWILFMWHFLSHQFVRLDSLKWLGKVCEVRVDSYDQAYKQYDKLILHFFSNVLTGVVSHRIKEWYRLIELMDPFLEVLNKVTNRRQYIVILNWLFHKFGSVEKTIIKTTQLKHQLQIQLGNVTRCEYYLLCNKSCQVVANSHGLNAHFNNTGLMYMFYLDEEVSVTQVGLAIKDKCRVAILSNIPMEPMRVYELQITQNEPIIHDVLIECEDKCSQQWNLDYVSQVQTQYRLKFTGDPEFKCRLPVVGVLKGGEILSLKVRYSPTNLLPHSAVLTISSQYNSEIYEIRGKPFPSEKIELERRIQLEQKKKHTEIIQFLWEQNAPKQPGSKNELLITEYNAKRPELVHAEIQSSKANRKEVRITLVYLFEKIYRNLQVLYQITDKSKTQSKIIRLLIDVTPRPVTVEGTITGELDKLIVEKIPVTNKTSRKAQVLIELVDVLRQTTYMPERLSTSPSEEPRQHFRLSKTGKLPLKPEQITHLELYYQPSSLKESTFTFKVTYLETQAVVNYIFKGIPEFPVSKNECIIIHCQVQERVKVKIPLECKLRQRTIFSVETNLKEIVGPGSVALSRDEPISYLFEVLTLRPGELFGQITFCTDKISLCYPIRIISENQKHFQQLKLITPIREVQPFEIALASRAKVPITYEVQSNCPALVHEKSCVVDPSVSTLFPVAFLPFKVGNTETQLKFYNETMPEILYKLTLAAVEHQESLRPVLHELGRSAKIKFSLKNPSEVEAIVEKPVLPADFTMLYPTMPAKLPPKGSIPVQIRYKPMCLQDEFIHRLTLKTDLIGDYNYIIKLRSEGDAEMEEIMFTYDAEKDYKRHLSVEEVTFLNVFQHPLKLKATINGDMELIKLYDIKVQTAPSFKIQGFSAQTIRVSRLIDHKADLASASNIAIDQLLHQDTELRLTSIEPDEGFNWVYPIFAAKVYSQTSPVRIQSHAHQIAVVNCKLQVISSIKRWKLPGFQDCEQYLKISYMPPQTAKIELNMTSKCEFKGYLMLYGSDGLAEKIPVEITVGEQRHQAIHLYANIGQSAEIQMRLKGGKGRFKINFTNNKKKEFDVEPLEGVFSEEQGEGVQIKFRYNPVEYSGIKKAFVEVVAPTGVYCFDLFGKIKNESKLGANKAIDEIKK